MNQDWNSLGLEEIVFQCRHHIIFLLLILTIVVSAMVEGWKTLKQHWSARQEAGRAEGEGVHPHERTLAGGHKLHVG